MTTMLSIEGILACLCTLTVLVTNQQHETESNNCNSLSNALDFLSQIKGAAECGESLMSKLHDNQTAAMLVSLRALTTILTQQQKQTCQSSEHKCQAVSVHIDGGIACVTISDKRYCKPMCNEGYDFSFLRKSRIYEECHSGTRYQWTTQYIGGNTLANCIKSNIQVSGAKTAYFPKKQDCMITKSNSTLQDNVIRELVSELRSKDIEGEPVYTCLLCG